MNFEKIKILNLKSFLERNVKALFAIAIVTSLFFLSKTPELSATSRKELAARFGFTRLPLPELAESLPQKSVRTVHPSIEARAAFYSGLGASVALNDLDGDGLSNDVCYVDPRIDRVIVAPLPGTSDRYEPFSLITDSFSHDASTMPPMGCLPGDLNEDGLMDILVYYWGCPPLAFLRTGVEASNSPVLTRERYISREIVPGLRQKWYTNAATIADLDGDGHNDLLLGNYYPEDVQILEPNPTDQGNSLNEYVGGGVNRIFLWAGATVGEEPGVKFQEAQDVLDEKVARGWTLAVGAADIDGDMLPEIYFANDFTSDRSSALAADRLLYNRSKPGELHFSLLEGKKSLTKSKSLVLGSDTFSGMGVDFADINRDGLPDIYVSNVGEYEMTQSHLLFMSTGEVSPMEEGIAPYVEDSGQMGLSRSGWAWDAKFGDFDNDGILEVLQATGWIKGEANIWPEFQERSMRNDRLIVHRGLSDLNKSIEMDGHQHNPFFVRAGNGRYYDLAQEVGLTDNNNPQVSRGIATADVDGDGDLDFAVANQWEPSYVYFNDRPTRGDFLGLHLLLPMTPDSAGVIARSGHPGNDLRGRPAIGATATVHLPDGQKLVAQVDGGNGHSGARSPDLHFGLGQLEGDTELPVDLRWRDSKGMVHQETLQLLPGWHTVLLCEESSKIATRAKTVSPGDGSNG